MRNILAGCLILGLVAAGGCSTGNVLSGAAGGAAGVGAYEYHLKKQKERVQADYDAKKIDEKEYKIRMDQIMRDSVF